MFTVINTLNHLDLPIDFFGYVITNLKFKDSYFINPMGSNSNLMQINEGGIGFLKFESCVFIYNETVVYENLKYHPLDMTKYAMGGWDENPLFLFQSPFSTDS